MKPSTKGGKGKRREGKRKEELPEHALVLRHRLHDALSLGIKFCADRKRKWQCQDAEITRHAVRLMSTFSGCISPNTSHHPLIKDTLSDILVAMEGILQSEHETILTPAADVIAKLLLNLGNSIRDYEYLDLVLPLSKLLSFHQMGISVSSSIALNCIISNLGLFRECRELTAIWDALKKTNAVESILFKLQDCPPDIFMRLASLLNQILQRWPESRYPVWNKIKLMDGPLTLSVDYGSSILHAVIQLFSALALCGGVAMLILERESLVSGIVSCLGSSQPSNVRIQAFTLVRNFSKSEKGCNLLMNICCEPLIQGIIHAIRGPLSSSHPGRIPNDQIPLVSAACQTAASMTRWPGAHHAYFWKLGIDCTLLDLLPVDFSESVITNLLTHPTNAAATAIRICAWNTLGFLSKHCEDSHFLKREERSCHIDTLIDSACLVAADLMFTKPSSKDYHTVSMSETESVSRAVVMMAFSPSNYISSSTRDALLRNVLKFGGDYIDKLVDKLGPRRVDGPHMVVDLSRLVLFSSLTQLRGLILERETVHTLISIIIVCINGEFHAHRSGIGSPKICCWSDKENPEAKDLILVYSLQALSQLLPSVESPLTIDQSLFSTLKKIAGDDRVDQDSRWYASYCLIISFDFYGFPNSLGDKIEGFMNQDELADLQLMLPNGETLRVHGAILVARCPALIPWEKLTKNGYRQVVHLSNNVDGKALMKLLEYVYTGYCRHVDGDTAKQLLLLAKRCGVKSLYYMLRRNLPKCSMPIPRCDFSRLMTLDGYPFSDIVLEAKNKDKWNCGTCELLVPHVHAHKIILIAGSSYMRALFQSGMRESHSGTIKVPITQGALLKLVTWFYSGELPKLEFDCRWSHLSSEEQFLELIIYLELSWLAESWCLEDVHRECTELVISCIETMRSFPLDILKSAAAFGCHEVVGAIVGRLGPLYPQLRDSREIDGFDEVLVEMLQSEYVHYSRND